MTLASTAFTWYVTRAGGMVAIVLLTAAVVLGLALAGRASLVRWPRFALEEVHRFAGLLAWAFVGVHVLVLLVDGYAPFSVADLVVPGSAGYRPLATGLGIVGTELLLALAVANRLRGRLPYRVWRRTHALTLAVWALAVAHSLLAGTDTGNAWGTTTYGVCVAAVAGVGVWRVLGRQRRPAVASR
ncbi:MAG: ferric reductase-like transmembrane domain-containing protein [Thermoleophilia bacterium]